MTEFTHRNASVTSADRVSAVRAVPPIGQTGSRADAANDAGSLPSVLQTESGGDEAARAHADYAKVNRDIADVVDTLSAQAPRKSPAVLAQAENALLSLLPQPSVVLPLPPADEDMVAFVAQVTQSIARQAAQTRAALSGVSAMTVEAATAE